mgnify:CR=1 FL=1
MPQFHLKTLLGLMALYCVIGGFVPLIGEHALKWSVGAIAIGVAVGFVLGRRFQQGGAAIVPGVLCALIGYIMFLIYHLVAREILHGLPFRRVFFGSPGWSWPLLSMLTAFAVAVPFSTVWISRDAPSAKIVKRVAYGSAFAGAMIPWFVLLVTVLAEDWPSLPLTTVIYTVVSGMPLAAATAAICGLLVASAYILIRILFRRGRIWLRRRRGRQRGLETTFER